ncbi:hypothetical protein EDWATA_02735 [Edwardsiella tarda ATCC 23685]|uniref:Uncharacterized protein n=1 Tax=Edwardsiella tarda ATCC 23685 TaxID=500638 RepID=D4F7J9_EDWTA|nr:hypothetical protein EDWATA_02735 [Edwardsiella tarda ATCC 23685]
MCARCEHHRDRHQNDTKTHLLYGLNCCTPRRVTNHRTKRVR